MCNSGFAYDSGRGVCDSSSWFQFNGYKMVLWVCLSLNINDFESFPCFCDSCICTLPTVSLAFILFFFLFFFLVVGPFIFFHKLLRNRVEMWILYMLFCCPTPRYIFFLDLSLGLLCAAGCFFDSVNVTRQIGSEGRGFMAAGRRTPLVEVRASAHDLRPHVVTPSRSHEHLQGML